jgi:hypothetical protein
LCCFVLVIGNTHTQTHIPKKKLKNCPLWATLNLLSSEVLKLKWERNKLRRQPNKTGTYAAFLCAKF